MCVEHLGGLARHPTPFKGTFTGELASFEGLGDPRGPKPGTTTPIRDAGSHGGLFHLQRRSWFRPYPATGFYGLLRTGELLSVKGSHITVNNPRGPAVISLGLTKSGKRQGAAESITIHVEEVCRRLFQWCTTQPKQVTLGGPSHIWRKKLSDALKALSFDKWDFRPYSLRRGGATHAFSQHGVFDKLLVAGRWQSQKTARIYVNQGLAVLAELKIPWTPFARNFRRQYLSGLKQQLPPLELVSRCSQVRGRRKSTRKECTRVACGGVRPSLVLGLAGLEGKKLRIPWLGVSLGFGRDPLGVCREGFPFGCSVGVFFPCLIFFKLTILTLQSKK